MEKLGIKKEIEKYKVLINTTSDLKYFLVFIGENQMKVSKKNDINIIVNYFKSLSDCEEVILK